MAKQDAVDERILATLRVDARITNAGLAERAGLSESACLRRVRRMEEDGTIRGYTAMLGGHAQRSGTVVFVQITLERQTADWLSRFEAAARACPEIRECYLMTGGADYQLQVLVQDMQEYEQLHRGVLSTLPGVARIESRFTIRQVIQAG